MCEVVSGSAETVSALGFSSMLTAFSLLARFSRSPERAYSKPAKHQGKASGNGHPVRGHLPCVIGEVLLHQGQSAKSREGQEHKACDLVPKLPQDGCEVPYGGAHPAQDGAVSPRALYLLSGDPGSNAKFP